jgi:hypothetical protein
MNAMAIQPHQLDICASDTLHASGSGPLSTEPMTLILYRQLFTVSDRLVHTSTCNINRLYLVRVDFDHIQIHGIFGQLRFSQRLLSLSSLVLQTDTSSRSRFTAPEPRGSCLRTRCSPGRCRSMGRSLLRVSADSFILPFVLTLRLVADSDLWQLLGPSGDLLLLLGGKLDG